MSTRKRQQQVAKRGRGTSVPLRRSFPWGMVLGSTALALVLVAVLGYAVVNQGSAAPDPLRDADAAVEGLEVTDAELERGHVPGAVDYDQTPSWGGEHAGVWSTCAGVVYDEQIPDENAAHSLEHGAVWVTYRPDLAKDQVAKLEELVDGRDYAMLSPYADLESPVVVQAWGRRVTAESADDPRVETFVKEFANGPQTPEKGATCSGGTTGTGTQPLTAQGGMG